MLSSILQVIFNLNSGLKILWKTQVRYFWMETFFRDTLILFSDLGLISSFNFSTKADWRIEEDFSSGFRCHKRKKYPSVNKTSLLIRWVKVSSEIYELVSFEFGTEFRYSRMKWLMYQNCWLFVFYQSLPNTKSFLWEKKHDNNF